MIFAWKTGALDATGLAAKHAPSAMSLGGLVKHADLIRESVDGLTGEDPPR